MLCPRCYSPLPPDPSRNVPTCARCGYVSADSSSSRSYSLAMATALKGDRPDTQPSMPIAALGASAAVSSSRHSVAGLWEGARRPERASASHVALRRPRPASEPYTLALLIADTFGANASPAALRLTHARRTRMQRVLVGGLGARLAATKWAPALAGGLLAMLVSTSLLLLAQLGCDALLAATLSPGLVDPGTGFVEAMVQALLGGSPAQLVALANLLPLLLFGAPSDAHLQFTPPLTSLALIPMLALVLGGALAGSSDFTQRARYSVARGALIGPVYAVLLTALTVFAGGRASGDALGLDGGATLIAAPQTALFYGLLWGCLCGALGGWLQLFGWRSRRLVLRRLARLRFKRLVGACVGAITALVFGLGVSLAVALVGVGYVLATGQIPQPLAGAAQAAHLGGTPQGILALVVLGLTLAPSLAIWVYALASGAPIALDRVTYVPPSALGSDFLSLGLSPALGATNALPHPAWYLLALIPVAAAFLGGRVAVRFAGATWGRAAFFTGALTAVPLALGSLLLASLASLSLQAMLPTGALIASVAPSPLSSLLPVLAVSALVAGLGGLSGSARRRARRRARRDTSNG